MTLEEWRLLALGKLVRVSSGPRDEGAVVGVCTAVHVDPASERYGRPGVFVYFTTLDRRRKTYYVHPDNDRNYWHLDVWSPS